MDATNLIAYLPFDNDTTDIYGNNWTTVGNPTITNKALLFNGSSYLYNDDIAAEIGSSPWTIHWRANCTASGECVFFGTFNAKYGTTGTGNYRWFRARFNSGNPQLEFWGASLNGNTTVAYNETHHYAVSYDGTNIYFFIDGVLKNSRVWETILGGTFRIGLSPGRQNSNEFFRGTIDEFIIIKGEAWTENFTPPTEDDYAALKIALSEYALITLNCDVERKVTNAAKTFRYENAGTADLLTVSGTTFSNLPVTQSQTGIAFYQTQRQKCFDVPATPEVWLKFDVFFDGSNRWRAYNGGANGTTGITAQTSGDLSFFSNDTNVQQFAGICKKNQLQTVLLHMTAGSSNGVIEAWLDGDFIYRYTGDVNHGELFADIYLQCDGGDTLFSNVIISNAEIGTDENAPADFMEITKLFDVEQRVTNTPNINEDTPPQISFSGNNNNYATLPEDVLPGATEFTIEAKFSTTSTKKSALNFEWGTIAGRELDYYWQNDFGLCVNDGKLCFWAEPSRNGSNSACNTTSDAIVNDGQIHTAAVRSNADGSIDLFCDGEIVAHTDNVNAKTPDTKNILVASNSNRSSALQMNLYEVRFWNTAREEIFADVDGTEEGLQGWYIPTENGLTDYSPNIRHATITGTVSYSEVNTVFVDVDYESTNDALGWRYEDCAVYFGTGAPINFHVPPTAEIWVRFDVYFDGVSRWYAYDDGIYGMTGITAQTSLELDFLSAGSTVKTLPDICKTKVTQTYLLHMISGVADGLIEVWCGLEKIGTYTGNVNNGRLFADFKLRSDDIGTSFTELIISNSELQPDEKPANTVRATKTSQLNTCNTKTEKIWLDRGGDYPFPYLDLTTREVLRQLITETIEGEGEFSPITTIWLKFDVYFDGINRWSAYNISETNGKNGVFSDLPLDFSFLANDFEVVRGQSVLLANQWQTVIVHMESAEAPNGMIDVWIDGVQMHQYLGNVNNGEEFTHIYLTSEGGGTMFKNFIASSAPLTEEDTPQTVATGMGQLAFTVRHNGEVLTVPLKLSAVPINPALTVRWQGRDWYNPLVLPSAENASEVAVRYNGAIYALSYF